LSGNADKELSVSIRFVIDPFEISVITTAKKAELSSAIIDLLNEIKQKQRELAESVTGIDLTKFKPIEVRVKAPEDPVDKVAAKIGTPAEQLRQILRVEAGVPIIIAKEKFGSPEKGAMVLIYAYQFGLDKKPNHEEVSTAFKDSGFTPAFGSRTKGALKTQEKIRIEKGEISLTGSGISDAEAEVKRIIGSAPK
jgi:rRNA-processing protein FCF1